MFVCVSRFLYISPCVTPLTVMFLPLYSTTGFCIDVNECNTDKGGCEDICVNVPGSHHCACPTGYSLTRNDRNCTDINECSDGSSGCSQLCRNTEGSFRCSCRSGYVLDGDGKTCSDFDECEMEMTNCSHICNNTAGSYFCSCRKGYRLQSDRYRCQGGYHILYVAVLSCPFCTFFYSTTTACVKYFMCRTGLGTKGFGCPSIVVLIL